MGEKKNLKAERSQLCAHVAHEPYTAHTRNQPPRYGPWAHGYEAAYLVKMKVRSSPCWREKKKIHQEVGDLRDCMSKPFHWAWAWAVVPPQFLFKILVVTGWKSIQGYPLFRTKVQRDEDELDQFFKLKLKTMSWTQHPYTRSSNNSEVVIPVLHGRCVAYSEQLGP